MRMSKMKQQILRLVLLMSLIKINLVIFLLTTEEKNSKKFANKIIEFRKK